MLTKSFTISDKICSFFPGVQSGKVTSQIFFKKILPMAVFFAGGLCLGNSAYQYISVAFIQMLKSMNPVPLLLCKCGFKSTISSIVYLTSIISECWHVVQFLTGRETPSILQLCIVVVISFGVSLSSVGELNFSLLGFLLQVRILHYIWNSSIFCFGELFFLFLFWNRYQQYFVTFCVSLFWTYFWLVGLVVWSLFLFILD